jgi:hypothetical protein
LGLAAIALLPLLGLPVLLGEFAQLLLELLVLLPLLLALLPDCLELLLQQ